MIHAYDQNGRSRCDGHARRDAGVVTQALYSQLCPACRHAIYLSCLRRQGKI